MNRTTYTVAQITTYIKKMFNDDYLLNNIAVSGEISNLKLHSGNLYFTLKDNMAAISCVMFFSNTKLLRFKPENGMKVEIAGSISVYEKDGKYQLYAREIRALGLGQLYEEFERLKNELCELGMFDASYKKPIPLFSQRVGIVTSDSGAAIEDIKRVSRNRNPYIKLYLCPANVQGINAARSIADAIRTIDKMKLDVLIVGRGGGSIEDLWCFNEREVANAIFSCNTPVISAVGHESDYTIADFVADAREATPSTAAAKAVFDYYDLENKLNKYKTRLTGLIISKLKNSSVKLESYEQKLYRLSPVNKLNNNRQCLDNIYEKMLNSIKRSIYNNRRKIAIYNDSLNQFIDKKLINLRHDLEIKTNSLKHLSPYEKLNKGYGFLSTGDGKTVKSVNDVDINTVLNIALIDGIIVSEVKGTNERKKI